MDCSNQVVWFGCDNGICFDFFPLLIMPDVIQPSKAEHLLIFQENIVRDFLTIYLLPLKEPASRNNTSLKSQGLTKRCFHVQGFSTGINHLIPDLLIFCPERHQSPPHQFDMVLTSVDNDR